MICSEEEQTIRSSYYHTTAFTRAHRLCSSGAKLDFIFHIISLSLKSAFNRA